MDKSGKFLLPSPKFKTLEPASSSKVRHFLSPQGIQLLTKEEQPPPMYGPRGSTLPPKFLSPLKVPTTTSHFDRKQKFFCEPCEAEFHTSTDYKVHRSEHVHCEIDECTFRGHPAFMETHIAQQHATGLYDQLKKLSTPEEIAQWRADRKKNYPTVASVEQKYKAREQRMLRGEKLEMENKKRFGNRADRRKIKGEKPRENDDKTETNQGYRNQKKKMRDRRFGKKKRENKVPTPPISKGELSMKIEEPEVASCGGLQMFKGTGALADYKKPKKTEANALSSLLGMYGSESEEDNEDNSEEEVNEGKAPLECTLSRSLEHSSEEISISDCTPSGKVEIEVASQEVSNEEKEAPIKQNSDKETIHIGKAFIQNKSNDEEATDKSNETKFTEESLIKDIPHAEAATASSTVKDSAQQSSDDEGPEEVAIAKSTNIPDKPLPEPPRKKSRTQPSDAEGPEETAISKSTNIPDKPQPEPTRKKPIPHPLKRKSALDYRKLRLGKQNTMLEKLLEADIRHERNILLQCVRFVVQNNFFDKPKLT